MKTYQNLNQERKDSKYSFSEKESEWDYFNSGISEKKNMGNYYIYCRTDQI